MANYGSQAMWGELERVLVRPPLPADANHVERYGWRGVPDAAAATAEHDELRALLAAAGAEVIVSEHDPGNPDAIYVYDPVLVGDDGAALLRPGKGPTAHPPRHHVASWGAHAVYGTTAAAVTQVLRRLL